MAASKIIFLLFFLIPFQFSLGSFGTSDTPILRLLIPGVVLAWVLHSLYSKNWNLPKPLTLFALSSFLLWAALSFFWAENPFWVVRKILFWLSFFPVFLVFISVFQYSKYREQSLRGLVWGGAAVALVGILQFALQFFIPLSLLSGYLFATLSFFLGANFAEAVAMYPSIFVNIGGITFLRAFAFFPDPHIFAYYTAMVFPLALYLALQKRSSRALKLLPGVLLVATLLSFSRASYVALLVAAIVFLGMIARKFSVKIPVVAVLVGISIAVLLVVSPVAERFTSSFSRQDGSVSERSRLWHEAIENIQKAPLVGVGLGNYPLLVKPSAAPREPIYVHNLYLDVTVELGLIGIALFLLFIFSCLPKAAVSTELLSYREALILSLIVFLTHSIFEYPLFSIHILTIFLALLALLYVEKNNV